MTLELLRCGGYFSFILISHERDVTWFLTCVSNVGWSSHKRSSSSMTTHWKGVQSKINLDYLIHARLAYACGFAMRAHRVPESASITRRKSFSASCGLVVHAIARVLNVHRASIFNILRDDTKSSDKTRLFREIFSFAHRSFVNYCYSGNQ